IRALLIDLSGSLHVGPTRRPPRPPLPRARQAGLVVRFCSNASQEGTRALRERLGGMGFDLRAFRAWIVNSPTGIEVRFFRPYALLFDYAMEEFPEFRSAERHHASYDSVLVAFASEHLAYSPLNKAFAARPAASPSSPDGAPPLLTTHRAKYLRTPDGELSHGQGPFISALEEAVGGGLRAQTGG
ncbi:hypothetical protein DFH11DRAFT_1461073, partial [Phellopilus nigrolimitatus]